MELKTFEIFRLFPTLETDNAFYRNGLFALEGLMVVRAPTESIEVFRKLEITFFECCKATVPKLQANKSILKKLIISSNLVLVV